MTTPATPATPAPKQSTITELLSFLPIVSLIPAVMEGIQQVHGDAIAGATKKQLAMESLGLATATADAALPGGLKTEADAVSAAASEMIDTFAKLFGATGWGKTTAIVTPAVAASKASLPQLK